MATLGWQICAGGVPLAVPTLSGATFGQPRTTKTRPALASIFPLLQVSRSPHRTRTPLDASKCVSLSLETTDFVILASADGANFRVSRNLLAFTSPVFHQMLSAHEPHNRELDSPSSSRSFSSESTCVNETLKDGTPLIRMPESGRTLDALLQYLYTSTSYRNGTFNGGSHAYMEEIKSVLDTAQKYAMRPVLDEICARLLSDLAMPPSDEQDTFALRIYALACMLKRKGLAEAAAYASLRVGVTGLHFSELEDLTALHYFRLLDYHRRCSSAVVGILEDEGYSTGGSLHLPHIELVQCMRCGDANGSAWWMDFTSAAIKVLRESPRSHRIFGTELVTRVYREAEKCPGNCGPNVRANWPSISVMLKEEIERCLLKVELDLSAFKPIDVAQSPTESEGRNKTRPYNKFVTIR